jgi:hypothetical protein
VTTGRRKASRFDLIYGRSGTGKSTWCLNVAKHLYETSGKTTRWYIGDGGTGTIEDSGLVEAGVIELCQYNIRENPMATSQDVCRGLWPKDPDDPTSPMEFAIPEKVGLFVIEGLSAMADYIMGSKVGGLAWRSAQGEKIGQDAPYKIEDGLGRKFGGNPMSHFGVVQRYVKDFVDESRVLPGMVLWTAHEKTATDRETQEKLIGPEVAGNALTARIGASFGNTIHLDQASKKLKTKDTTTGKDIDALVLEYRAYFTTHFDPEGISLMKYYANNRCATPAILPKTGYLTPPDPIAFYALLKKGQLSLKTPATTAG